MNRKMSHHIFNKICQITNDGPIDSHYQDIITQVINAEFE